MKKTSAKPLLLTDTEADFFRSIVVADKAQILRNGWPDFLLKNNSGKIYGVEVKSRSDDLSSRQRAMFAMLTEAGIHVYVWTPATPKTLIPWHKFTKAKSSRVFASWPSRLHKN